MSYDIMIIDRHPRFKDSKEFLEWYDDVIEWKEDLDYNDCEHATPHLKEWFMKMKDIVRPMNGKYALSDEEIDRCLDADYAIAREGIMMAMGYSEADKICEIAFKLAKEYGLSYFDISGSNELHNPDGSSLFVFPQQEDNEVLNGNELQAECEKELKRRRVVARIALLAFIALLLLIMYVFPDKPWAMPVGGVSTLAFLIFCIWGIKWQKRTNEDVMKRYQQRQAEEESARHAKEREGLKPILEDVMWNFQIGAVWGQIDLYNALIKYNAEHSGKPIAHLLEEKIECLGAETDIILFDEDSEEAETYNNPKVHLKADDGVSFTGLELLFKLNNELHPLLKDSDFIFFEGITCQQQQKQPTVCRVLLGS